MTNVVNIKRQHKHVAKAIKLVYDYTLGAIRNEVDRIDTEYDTAIKLLAKIAAFSEAPTEFIADMNADLKDMINSINKD